MTLRDFEAVGQNSDYKVAQNRVDGSFGSIEPSKIVAVAQAEPVRRVTAEQSMPNPTFQSG
jgi:hypothetical protein